MRIHPVLIASGIVFLAASANAALIAEWTFDTGNTDPAWSSDYLQAPPADIHNAGIYMIGTNPQLGHASWTSYAAQAGDQMMICNGGLASPVSLEAAWWNVAPVALVAGQQYEFSFYSANSYPASPASLQVNVSGGVGNLGTFVAAGVGVWQLNTVAFTAPTTGGYTFRLNNLDGQYTGNDFALDSIRVESVPEPVMWTLFALSGLMLTKRRRA